MHLEVKDLETFAMIPKIIKKCKVGYIQQVIPIQVIHMNELILPTKLMFLKLKSLVNTYKVIGNNTK